MLESDRSRIRLTVGVSTPAEGVTALDGALHEAQSALRLAAVRAAAMGPAPAVSVVTSDEVASYELLLASVPGSVLRSFRERLIGPLLAYDEAARGRAAAHPAGVPGLLGLMERVCGRDVRARQHGAVPDQAHRGADRT